MHTSEKNFAQFTFHYVINIGIKLCDDAHHLNALFKAGSRAANVVLTWDLVPAGTVLLTSTLKNPWNFYLKICSKIFLLLQKM